MLSYLDIPCAPLWNSDGSACIWLPQGLNKLMCVKQQDAWIMLDHSVTVRTFNLMA